MEQKRKRKRKSLAELQLTDNFLFGEVMSDAEICRDVLEIIFGKKIQNLEHVNTEQVVSGGYTQKGIRMDVYLRDIENIHYDVEMQVRNYHNLPKRSRHYQAVYDVRVLPVGETDYEKLPESRLIFICAFDEFGKGRYCYTFENRCIEDLSLSLGDGVQKIILCTKGENEKETRPELIEFLRLVENVDFFEPKDERVKRIKERALEIKSKEGMEDKYMLAFIKENEIRNFERKAGMQEGLQKGLQAGRREERRMTVQRMMKKGMGKEEVADCIGISLLEVETLCRELNKEPC